MKICRCGSLAGFGFQGVSRDKFSRFQWWGNTQLFLLYRTVVFLFQLGWFLSGLLDRQDDDYFFKLSNWCMLYSTLYYFLALVTSIYENAKEKLNASTHIHSTGNGCGEANVYEASTTNTTSRFPTVLDGSEDRTLGNLLWFHKASWILQTITMDTLMIVTITYWIIIYPFEDENRRNIHGIAAHVLNITLLLFDMILIATPVRILHALYMILSTLLYSLFLGVVYVAEGKIVYGFLDFKVSPVAGLGTLLALDTVGSIFAHSIWFGIYFLRLKFSQIRDKNKT